MSDMTPWFLAIRPRTLPAAFGPVAVGAALAVADGSFSLTASAAAVLLALLLQIAVNLANDYFDGIRGVDTEERLGPVRATQSGLISASAVRNAMITTLAVSLIPGGYLIALGGWPLFWLGVASMLSALAYSGGPFPLASNALGDLFVFLFFGLVAVCGTFYVQSGELTGFSLLMASAVGFMITAIIVVNNLRDIPTDSRVGKHTLAVVLGATGARWEFTALLAAGYALPLSAALFGHGGFWLLLPLLSAPRAVRLNRRIWRTNGTALNAELAATAKLSLAFCLLLALGIALS